MKKRYMAILFVFISNSVYSQSSIIGVNPTIWNTGDGSTYVNSYVDIVNVSTSTIDVMVERKSETLTPGHVSNFCWGVQCYPPFIGLSPIPEPIPAGATNSSFKGELNPNGIPGLSRVTYCFFNQNNTADSVCFEFFYDITLGLNENTASGSYLSSPSPNPANTMAAFSYRILNPKGEIKMVINNLLGKTIQELKLNSPSKNFILNTSTLQPGIYLCSLINGEQPFRTVKLTVAR
jgi:hypothetical protein